MSRNNYKKNTYALIKRGEIYEITKEGNVKKAKNRDNVPFYTKYKISQVLYKMPKKKASKFLLVKKGDFIQMEKKGGAEKFFCSLMHPTYAKESKWTLFADNLVTLLPYMNKEYKAINEQI